MGERIFNFNPGPAVLPVSVLEQIRDEFLDFRGSGMSIIEISHRSKWFDDVINDAVLRIKRLLHLGDDYQVLFLQGGASLQFSMVPMNLLAADQIGDSTARSGWSSAPPRPSKKRRSLANECVWWLPRRTGLSATFRWTYQSIQMLPICTLRPTTPFVEPSGRAFRIAEALPW